MKYKNLDILDHWYLNSGTVLFVKTYDRIEKIRKYYIIMLDGFSLLSEKDTTVANIKRACDWGQKLSEKQIKDFIK